MARDLAALRQSASHANGAATASAGPADAAANANGA
jgi:hypothetical protein